jgi:hypothetical protein
VGHRPSLQVGDDLFDDRVVSVLGSTVSSGSGRWMGVAWWRQHVGGQLAGRRLGSSQAHGRSPETIHLAVSGGAPATTCNVMQTRGQLTCRGKCCVPRICQRRL